MGAMVSIRNDQQRAKKKKKTHDRPATAGPAAAASIVTSLSKGLAAVPGASASPVTNDEPADLAAEVEAMEAHAAKEALNKRLQDTQKQLVQLQLRAKAQALERLRARAQQPQQPEPQRLKPPT